VRVYSALARSAHAGQLDCALVQRKAETLAELLGCRRHPLVLGLDHPCGNAGRSGTVRRAGGQGVRMRHTHVWFPAGAPAHAPAGSRSPDIRSPASPPCRSGAADPGFRTPSLAGQPAAAVPAPRACPGSAGRRAAGRTLLPRRASARVYGARSCRILCRIGATGYRGIASSSRFRCQRRCPLSPLSLISGMHPMRLGTDDRQIQPGFNWSSPHRREPIVAPGRTPQREFSSQGSCEVWR